MTGDKALTTAPSTVCRPSSSPAAVTVAPHFLKRPLGGSTVQYSWRRRRRRRRRRRLRSSTFATGRATVNALTADDPLAGNSQGRGSASGRGQIGNGGRRGRPRLAMPRNGGRVSARVHREKERPRKRTSVSPSTTRRCRPRCGGWAGAGAGAGEELLQ